MTDQTETPAAENTDAYYAEKGKVRFMMVTSKAHKAELSRRCKELGVTHGALLEIFLDMFDAVDKHAMNLAVQAKRVEKKTSRVSFSSINKQLKGLSKEQLAAIEKVIAEQKALAAKGSE